jgi:hypothetical protein
MRFPPSMQLLCSHYKPREIESIGRSHWGYLGMRCREGCLNQPIPKYDGILDYLPYPFLHVVALRSEIGSDSRKIDSEDYMKKNRPLVSVVDDDESVRHSPPNLLKESGEGMVIFPCS